MPNDLIPGKDSKAKSLEQMTPEELMKHYTELQKQK